MCTELSDVLGYKMFLGVGTDCNVLFHRKKKGRTVCMQTCFVTVIVRMNMDS